MPKQKLKKSNPMILLVVVAQSGASGSRTIEIFDPKKPLTPEDIRNEISDIAGDNFDFNDERGPLKVYRYDIPALDPPEPQEVDRQLLAHYRYENTFVPISKEKKADVKAADEAGILGTENEKKLTKAVKKKSSTKKR